MEIQGKHGVTGNITPIVANVKRGITQRLELTGYRVTAKGETREVPTLEDALDWIDTLKRR